MKVFKINTISVIRSIGITSLKDMSSRRSFWEGKRAYHIIGHTTTEYALRHPDVQQFFQSSTKYYDLILVEQYYQDAFLMLSHQFQAPVVSICNLSWFKFWISIIGIVFFGSNLRMEHLFRHDVWLVRCLGSCSTRDSGLPGRYELRATSAKRLLLLGG